MRYHEDPEMRPERPGTMSLLRRQPRCRGGRTATRARALDRWTGEDGGNPRSIEERLRRRTRAAADEPSPARRLRAGHRRAINLAQAPADPPVRPHRPGRPVRAGVPRQPAAVPAARRAVDREDRAAAEVEVVLGAEPLGVDLCPRSSSGRYG